MDTLEKLRGKTEGARDLKSVVSAMKAMAGSNIIQYEAAVGSLAGYYHTIALGLVGYFRAEKIQTIAAPPPSRTKPSDTICAIVFGSDQGLVARFNDSMAHFVSRSLAELPGKKDLWVVGERVQLLLEDEGFTISRLYTVPNELDAVTPLVSDLLRQSREREQAGQVRACYIFHHRPGADSGYAPVMQRFLPLDVQWKNTLQEIPWPNTLLPQIAGRAAPTLTALIGEYLFTSLFRACVESLASENASRLAAMQRAENNIDGLLESLNQTYHRLRQSTIDEELFDVISGFEALKKSPPKEK
ncbi:MAG: F0F1 ATP synthase subunit gamma [Lewinella sp.]